jgi:pyruvate formate lyase activating enzyme
MLKIADLTKFTMQDFPGKIACIIWFAGCNMKCRYCHNTTLLKQTVGFLTEDFIFDFLETRIGLIEGVVLSGGECSVDGDNVVGFIKKIKKLNFKVKIDTNGLNYNFIENIINNNLIDFIALDYKSPKEKFDFITNTFNQYDNFIKSLKFIINSNINKEIRTTVHTDLLNEDDINNMIKTLENFGYRNSFFIQNFRDDNNSVEGVGKQKFILDREKIIDSKLFSVEYRNFF